MNLLNIQKPNYNECHVNNLPVDASIIVKNKIFHEDEVNDDLSLKVSKRDEFLIGGVIKFKNMYTFEYNDKGIEMFEFIPINWRYPKFLVATNIKKNLIKSKKKVIDYFVVIKFKEWKTKIPIGHIEKCLGPVDEIINQYDILFHYYPPMPIVKPEPINIELKKTNLTIKTDVYSIDPEGCIDIDDALSYDFQNKRIGVHIADVADIIDTYNFNKYSTVYAPHKNVPMFPENISTFIASLREGQMRNVITCWINNDGSYNFEENCIKVTKNLTYENAEILKNSNEILKILYEKSIELGKNINIDVIDTHKMVEVYMILYNQYICELLENRKNMIYRNQKLYGKAVYEFKRVGH
jgi:exoribonuclease R